MEKRILIVEDDLICFKIASMLFQMAECEIEHAGSGEDALDFYALLKLFRNVPYFNSLEMSTIVHIPSINISGVWGQSPQALFLHSHRRLQLFCT